MRQPVGYSVGYCDALVLGALGRGGCLATEKWSRGTQEKGFRPRAWGSVKKGVWSGAMQLEVFFAVPNLMVHLMMRKG